MCVFHTGLQPKKLRWGSLHGGRSGSYKGEVAFTLIELLVVIGIVGVLMTILFTAVGRSQLKGQAVVSQNNLRQLAGGFLNYELLHGDYMPHELTRQGKWVESLREQEGYSRKLFQSPAALDRRWCGPGNARENWRVRGPESTYEHITRI